MDLFKLVLFFSSTAGKILLIFFLICLFIPSTGVLEFLGTILGFCLIIGLPILFLSLFK